MRRGPCNPCSSAWIAKRKAKQRKRDPKSNAARTIVRKKEPSNG